MNVGSSDVWFPLTPALSLGKREKTGHPPINAFAGPGGPCLDRQFEGLTESDQRDGLPVEGNCPPVLDGFDVGDPDPGDSFDVPGGDDEMLFLDTDNDAAKSGER